MIRNPLSVAKNRVAEHKKLAARRAKTRTLKFSARQRRLLRGKFYQPFLRESANLPL